MPPSRSLSSVASACRGVFGIIGLVSVTMVVSCPSSTGSSGFRVIHSTLINWIPDSDDDYYCSNIWPDRVFELDSEIILYMFAWADATPGDAYVVKWYAPHPTADCPDGWSCFPFAEIALEPTGCDGKGRRPGEFCLAQPGEYRVALEVNGVEVDSITFELRDGGNGSDTGHDDIATISDSTMVGLDGRDIRATIDVEPNSGPFGTPVEITITFSRGGSEVGAIETWQATEVQPEFHRTEFDDWGYRIDPIQESTTRWTTEQGLFLTGGSGIVRYYALDSSGTRIALGDVDVNGGL